MSEPIDQLRHNLRQHGYSLTKSRQSVFQALASAEPRTMHELIELCDGIDRASVYRTVAVFEQLGIIQRLQMGWKYKIELTDSFVHHHHHLSCSHCGQVIALPEDKQLEARLLQLARGNGFAPQDHQLEIRGLCATCQKA